MASCIAFHAHHEAELPIEFLTVSYATRLNIINTEKAREEEAWKIELRKKLFREILPANLPPWLVDLLNQLNDLQQQGDALLSQCRSLWLRRDFLLSQRSDFWNQGAADLWKQHEDPRRRPALLIKSADLWLQQADRLIAFHDSLCACGWTRTNNNIFNFASLRQAVAASEEDAALLYESFGDQE